AEAPTAGAALVGLGAVVSALLTAIGVVQARSTVYTITNRRVAMRIGAALTVTLNLPFTQIRNAELSRRPDGTGTIAPDLMGGTRLSYPVCGPHVRPWVLRRTRPALRCIPDAATVARLLADAAEARINTPRVARATPTTNAAPVAAE
ncbi:photosynthetic complex putative assembly protein PuhB, partial [Roseovarius sp. SYSU LYC5161]|uniref:photosynthetic complex putative assembly protein PuhB n=1 Tax=Roseovarius halophilus (ex Wu et al. 2025) TaxID=3376060 RepID=UPI0039997B07